MTVKKDNHIDPELKARWGFGGEAGKITVGPETVGETGGVDHARSRIASGSGRAAGGGDQSTLEAIQLSEVNKLAEGLESGVLNPVEGDGPALRLHAALSGIQGSMKSLSDARNEALAKNDVLQKQVDDLLQQIDKSSQADAEAKEIAELKAKLDAANVTYRANASKESLQKQVDELSRA
ncbi:hypothetical protein L6218_06080 [Pseudomonas syringae pv. syringae]|uniref:hypothetical protein n=1 Tax=Pseudomonas TaxID=286 RepID=UPI001F0D072A|nr:hypothetical protein [Pseudomonas syringae]MCH5497957.1 hypothetical protein [Pseudomonas syringae pv. syringae]MCH5523947.1 hypothetical protein [Pseudomonas syringae pv. syringae]MCH5559037.1 hypothetical protein [Pseudomonas syringae pv. syringae]MCH5564167.1 hypothetical protein [Pseudomonas syringae pv. syringae]MCH5581034.1 hypothetical protein [Pseudomonas syringae pv. syringae]